jgi:hypothetical protein
MSDESSASADHQLHDLDTIARRLGVTIKTVRRLIAPGEHYRDGQMIALLAYRPLRLKNFASTVVGPHLIRENRSTGNRIRMHAKEAFGASLQPHRFRNPAATSNASALLATLLAIPSP